MILFPPPSRSSSRSGDDDFESEDNYEYNVPASVEIESLMFITVFEAADYVSRDLETDSQTGRRIKGLARELTVKRSY